MIYKNQYSKGDRVETVLGNGEIISDIELTGACRVRLDAPLDQNSVSVGDDEVGQTEVMMNTFQMRHEKEGAK